MPSTRLASLVTLAAILPAAVPAAADPHAPGATSTPDVRAARELFARAEEDEDGGRWDDALEKLRRVLAVKDTAGVRYHVALCEEQLGKLATAWSDFTVADQKARSEPARDVLRLVTRKLAGLDRRVPRLTVRVVPSGTDATLTIDGQPARIGEETRVDPGPHQVEVLPVSDRPPTAVAVSMQEGDSRELEVDVAPPVAERVAPDAGAPPPSREGAAAPPRAPRVSRAAVAEAAAAAALAGGGVAAFVAAGAARDQASRDCALVSSASVGACDPYRVPVRVWDWVAVGAWTGAGVMATLSVLTWARAPAGPGRVVVGAGSVRFEGSF